ncbi:IucA/IucC family protein [Shouchella hunanensis]|uniref:IucA/IucC family protein n=1 Tax=Shouchella hunanensis TaxID=766894 RepID=A0ABY7W2Q7_9BACI|nr:IucA/IucC family protein [Shouchella hunanensis]WDF03154.1 IucA/IucC family protein [Shouchella hunanensis]
MQKPSNLPSRAEQRVIRQCFEAILYEHLLPYNEIPSQNGWTFFLIRGEKHVYRCLGKRSAFDRIRLHGMPLMSVQAGTQTFPRIEDIVEDAALSVEQSQALYAELSQTVLLSEWNEQNIRMAKSRRLFTYEQLEGAIGEGHPYHPCFKARTGFSLKDHRAYGNEAGADFSLVWLGVKKEDVNTYYPEEEHSFLQKEFGYGTWKKVVVALCQSGGQLYDYRVLPVHPWQWNAIQSNELKEAIETKDVLYLGTFGDRYNASQSIRTVMNKDNPLQAQLKLPLRMINTSSLRTVQPESVAAAPDLSRWLHEVVEQDPFLHKKHDVRLLKEYAGASYEPSRYPWIAGNINVIFRESVQSQLQRGERAIPLNALSLKEKDGSLFVALFLKDFGIEAWVKQFIEVAVVPVVHLCLAHGIAVEAHGQNMILILSDTNWPIGVLLRDFHDSLEYYEPYVKKKEAIPNFHEIHSIFKEGATDDYYWMSSPEALRELVVDTLFVYHLAELSWQLECELDFEEETFWNLVNQSLSRYVQREDKENERIHALHLHKEVMTTESLFRKKWTGEKESRHLIKNAIQLEGIYAYH